VKWATVVGWFALSWDCRVRSRPQPRALRGVFTTGYRSGLVTFHTSAIGPNIERMPSRLIESLPMSVLALVTVVWIVARMRSALRSRSNGASRRDVGVVFSLGAAWLALWALYSAYTWTVGQTLGPAIPFTWCAFTFPSSGRSPFSPRGYSYGCAVGFPPSCSRCWWAWPFGPMSRPPTTSSWVGGRNRVLARRRGSRRHWLRRHHRSRPERNCAASRRLSTRRRSSSSENLPVPKNPSTSEAIMSARFNWYPRPLDPRGPARSNCHDRTDHVAR